MRGSGPPPENAPAGFLSGCDRPSPHCQAQAARDNKLSAKTRRELATMLQWDLRRIETTLGLRERLSSDVVREQTRERVRRFRERQG
jgi:hypothetical protein